MEWFHKAPVATGASADEFAVHNLHIGGACAWYYVFGDVDLIRRYGRWASSALHVYLLEARPATKLVSRGMVRDTQPLMAAKGLGTDATCQGVSFAV